MNTSISAVLYTSKRLQNGEHPLMLRLTKEGKRKYISLHLSLRPEFWDSDKCQPRRHCPNRDRICQLIQQRAAEYQEQVIEFKTNEHDYTLHTLVEKTENPIVRQTVGIYLNGYIDTLMSENRVGNAKTFKELRTSLINCHTHLDFYFIEIDRHWLKRYELWLRGKSYSDNTIGIRMRSLRALYNAAMNENLVRRSNYPFTDYKVSQFKEQTAKRSLSKLEIQRIVALDLSALTKYPTPFMAMARDLFLFSYYTCGINLTDMLHLTYENIAEDRVTFRRQKTGKLLSYQLQPPAMAILCKYGKPQHAPSDYIFPILKRQVHVTAEQQYGRVQRANKRINHHLKAIGKALTLPIPLTTYVARHTFATVLKRSGVNVAIISESLGHSDLKTTQIYLDSFENTQIDEAMKHLL